VLYLLFKKTSFLFQNDLSHCSASSIVFFSASAVTGVMRYLVLKSNGLRHSKKPPVKFSFSLKIVPATIAKKLPSQRCSQPFLIAFSTSRTNGPHSLSQMKAGTHSAFGERLHTTAYTPKQEPSLPRPQRGLCCQRNCHRKNSRRKRMHAYGVCPLPPASRPRWAA
jgi:hypothetical protein